MVLDLSQLFSGLLAILFTIIGYFSVRVLNRAEKTYEKIISIETRQVNIEDEVEIIKKDLDRCKERLIKVESRCQFEHRHEVTT